MTRLVFRKPPASSPVRLVFGGSSFSAPPVTIHAQAQAPLPTFSCAIVYDNRVVRNVAAVTSASRLEHGRVVATKVDSEWRAADQAATTPKMVHQHGSVAELNLNAASTALQVVGIQSGIRFEHGLPVGDSDVWSAYHGNKVTTQVRSLFEHGIVAAVSASSPEERALVAFVARLLSHNHGLSSSRSVSSRSGSGEWAGLGAFRFPWQQAQNPPIGRTQVPTEPPGPEPFTPTNRLVFQCPPQTTTVHLVFGHECAPVDPNTVVVPVQGVYIVSNVTHLRRLSDGAPIKCERFNLSIDFQSWTWNFDASVDRASADLVEPITELVAHVNGTEFKLISEEMESDKNGTDHGLLSIRGRGHMANLDAPYAPVQTFQNASARTAVQLMNDVLTLNGQPIGYSVTWGLTDWLVPAGVFSHRGTYVSAINQIAAAPGAYILPHPFNQSFQVLPTYPTMPWTWSTESPDLILPSSVTSREYLGWRRMPAYNRVFVSGENDGGVLVRVTRPGSAGDVAAPMVVDPLITALAAGLQRGQSILGNTGRQVDIGLRLPVLDETGIIMPGTFVQYTDGPTIRKGLVRSVAIEVKFPEVWQSLGVETHA